MKNKMVLSIALGSLVGLSTTHAALAQYPHKPSAAQAVQIKSQGGGKCASGKCGTEKIYSQAKILHNPQDRLVRARDGKCGLDAKGLQKKGSEVSALSRGAEGVCGQ